MEMVYCDSIPSLLKGTNLLRSPHKRSPDVPKKAAGHTYIKSISGVLFSGEDKFYLIPILVVSNTDISDLISVLELSLTLGDFSIFCRQTLQGQVDISSAAEV